MSTEQWGASLNFVLKRAFLDSLREILLKSPLIGVARGFLTNKVIDPHEPQLAILCLRLAPIAIGPFWAHTAIGCDTRENVRRLTISRLLPRLPFAIG